MPALPTIISEQSVRVGGIDVYADGNNFGAQVGRAFVDAGAQLRSVASSLRAEKKQEETRTRQERLATITADGAIEFSKINAENQVNAPADGSGVFDKTLNTQREWIEKTAGTIEDPILRQQFRTDMVSKLVPYAQSNKEYEINQNAKNRAAQTDYTLRGLENTVRANSDAYSETVAAGHKIIDAQQGVPAAAKETMKREWTERSANARFQGLLDVAASPEDFDNIGAELQKDDWQKAFKPEEFDRVQRELQGAKKAFVTAADTSARGMIDSARSQIDTGLVPIDAERMQQINDAAMLSGNPTTIRRAMELNRHNQIILSGKRLPAAELENRSNTITNGGYPGMPDEVNKAINSAVSVFPSLPATFFGGTAVLEYGQYLPRGSRKGSSKFTPTAIHKGVNISGLAPQAVNAATIAGEIFGAPLPLTSAFRSQAKQNALRYAKGKNPMRASIAKESPHTHGHAIDVSTVGMSGAQKAKLVDALLQAGFTAFGEYNTHIHADMRAVTPKSYNPSTGHLGWTKGSPEVIGALNARGYGASMPAGKINRGGGVRSQEKVDYSRGTSNGSTSATGLYQFVEDTWLGVMRDPSIQARIGVPQGLSDAQLLEMRKDEYWSTMAAGAYAEQNQKTLRTVLGRDVSDSELYMAHFLGAGGAQTLIAAYTSNPDAIAAELMPTAAKNNPGRFAAKGGRPFTVREVYDNINVQFSTAPNQVAYGDAQVYKRMSQGQRKRETDDTMTVYSQNVAPVNNLAEPGGYASRGAYVLSAAELYDLPVTEVKPFTTEETPELTRTMSEGTVDAKLALMQQINEMDRQAPGAGKAAFEQLGQKDSVLSYAAALANERGATGVAETIVRGQERLREGKALSRNLFGKEGEDGNALQVFNDTTGGAFSALPPGAFDAAFEAAKAYYAEKNAGRVMTGFDSTSFSQAVQAVTGSENPDAPAIADINGVPTIVPKGVTAIEFDRVVENLTDSDLVQFSQNGLPPVDIHGEPIAGNDVSASGELVWLGGTSYKVRMTDGNYLVTPETDGRGRLKLYIFDADPQAIKQRATEPVDATMMDPTAVQNMTDEQQQELFDKGIEQMYGTR